MPTEDPRRRSRCQPCRQRCASRSADLLREDRCYSRAREVPYDRQPFWRSFRCRKGNDAQAPSCFSGTTRSAPSFYCHARSERYTSAREWLHQTIRFQTTLTWLSQIILFLTLGFFADMHQMPAVFPAAFVLSLVLMLFARPLSVFICLKPFHYSLKEKLFISFVGLRGATSVLLALAPLVMEIPAAQSIFSIIFLMVLMSLTAQGLLIIPVAKKCHVVLPLVEKPALKSEIDLPGLTDSFLITYKLTENTPAVQGAKLPRWAMPVYVQREDMSYKGANIKTFKPGDQIYVFASDETSAKELDHFYGGGQTELSQNMGDFILSPDIALKDLAYFYNIHIPKKRENLTLRESLEQNFSDLDVGDRLLLGKVELVVRKKENDIISEIGLILEPQKENQALTRLLKFKRSK